MSDLLEDMPQMCQSHDINNIKKNKENSSLASAAAYAKHMDSDIASDDANEAEDEIANILSLKLRKPKHWKWELSTSRSCSNIALPRILLYDHRGRLLVDVNDQEDQVYGQSIGKSQSNATKSHNRKRRSAKAATESLVHSINQALNQDFDGLQIQEASPSLLSPTNSTHNTRNSSPGATSSSCIDIFTNDLPDYKFERRSSSLRNVRFVEEVPKPSSNSFQIGDLPTPPPSSGTTPTTSSSGPREKRRYRRSHSSGQSGYSGPINSPSILERFSFNKGRFSSPEHAEEMEVYRPPLYFLRTSKAGTLVVQQESFSRCRRRQLRPRHSSSENILNDMLPRSRSACSSKMGESKSLRELLLGKDFNIPGSLENISAKRKHRRKRAFSHRRHRSDGQMLFQSNLSTSEDESYRSGSRDNGLNFVNGDRRSSRGNLKRHLKDDLVTIHPENGVLHSYGSPTER